MFTGIINYTGTVTAFEKNADGAHMTVSAPRERCDRVAVGSSMSHNGVCLTVIKKEIAGDTVLLSSFLMNETLRLTSFANTHTGDCVNLESSLVLGDELGGHFIFGHVDGVGIITDMRQDGDATVLTVSAPPKVASCLAVKGSVGVEGVSLTITETGTNYFVVSLIPHTLAVTNLKNKKTGDKLNIEVDMLARYVHAALHAQNRI